MMGIGEILVVGAAVVLVFSWRKIPELGRSVGKSIRGFKTGLKGKDEERPVRDVTPLEKPGEGPKDSQGE